MSSQYPSLKPKEICKCLLALGFTPEKGRRGNGDHKCFKKGDKSVEVDMGEKTGFAVPGMKIIIENSKYSREIFYRATKKTAKKIDEKQLTKEELSNI